MPDETRRLLTAAERMAALTDDLSETFASELGRVVRDIERRIAVLLRGLETPGTPGERTRQATVARLAALRDQLRETLTQAGYDDLVTTGTTAAFDRMVDVVRASRVGRAVSRFVTDVVAQRIDALRVLAVEDILHQGDRVARALYRAVRDGVLGGTPTPVLLERVAETLDLQVQEVRTLYDTAASTFGRVMEQQASDGTAEEAFLYAGPVDAKMRPFCADHIGKVYTRAQIQQMDNGQRLDVFLTGGGWNCRHTWMRLAPASELAPLANTGERAPEVAAALRDVQPMKKAKAA